MRRSTTLWLLPLLACGEPQPLEEVRPCEGLSLRVLDQVAEPPANVAAIVRVTDCGDTALSARLEPESFVLAEDGAELSSYEATRMIRSADRTMEARTLIALDLSGSITRAGLRPLMMDAARQIVTGLDATHQIAVFGFDGRPDLIPFSYFTDDRAELDAAFAAAEEAALVDDSTNLHGAITNALAVLDHAVRIEEQDLRTVAHGSLVLFTDGTDHAGWVGREEVETALDTTSHSVFAIGIGPAIDHEALAKLGRTDFALATEPETLDGSFDGVSKDLQDRAAADYVVSYCSPARSGLRSLEIRATHGELTGRTEITFDATGFGAGCTPEASPLR